MELKVDEKRWVASHLVFEIKITIIKKMEIAYLFQGNLVNHPLEVKVKSIDDIFGDLCCCGSFLSLVINLNNVFANIPTPQQKFNHNTPTDYPQENNYHRN